MSDSEHAHEVLIIKRHGGGHEDAHHGGVWKIAFADFMTAMMAFFLVMWLISANDKTKATIASYFNPVKLVDTTTQPKGLDDAKAVESAAPTKAMKNASAKQPPTKEENAAAAAPAESKEAQKPGGEEGRSKAAEKEKHLAAAIVAEPFAALTEIAGSKGAGDHSISPPTSTTNKMTVAAISRRGGEAFRDPFAPPPPLQAEMKVTPSDDAEDSAKPVPPGGDPKVASPPAGKKPPAGFDTADVDEAPAATKSKSGAQTLASVSASDLKAQLTAAAKSGGADKAGPQIEVRRAEGGLLVSLTDSADFEMFGTGSIVPSRKVVQMMDRIAAVLKTKPGQIVVRGYTDARPYKNGRYDNWRLSLDRAQVVHSMLVRGGFAETRIGHIEGYADRGLRNPADPGSAVNRRIEILLKE